MSNPTKIYNDYVRANLPSTMTFDSTTVRYDINNHSFFKFKKSNWYFKYITKFGYASLSAYAVNNFDPDLVFDFKQNYYRTGGTATTLSSAVTHARAGQATMVDSDGLLKWAPHNLVPYSEDQTQWDLYLATTTRTADRITFTTASTDRRAATVSDGIQTVEGLDYKIVADFTVDDGLPVIALGTWGSQYKFAWASYDTTLLTSDAYTLSDTVTTITVDSCVNISGNIWRLTVGYTAGASTPTAVVVQLGAAGQTASQLRLAGVGTGSCGVTNVHSFRSDLGGMVNNPTTSNSYVPTTNSAVYAPRVGHHVYNGSAWVNEGVLHESEARTNLMVYSGDLANGWSGSMTVGAVTTGSPFGTYQTISPTSTSGGGLQRYQIGKVITSGSTYVGWALVKYSSGSGWFTINMYDSGKGNERVWFDLQNGVVGSKESLIIDHNMVDYGDGWWLCWASSNAASTSGGVSCEVTNNNNSTAGNTSDVILIAGTQFEAGATPSSYIPTSSSTVTRAAETLTVPAANLPYSSTNVSIQMDGKMTYADTGSQAEVSQYHWHQDSTNYIMSLVTTTGSRTGQQYFAQRQSISGYDKAQGGNNTYSPDTNVPFNIASRHGPTFINGAHEGTALTANTTPTILPDLSSTDLDLGYIFMGTIGQFRVWDEDLGDTGIEEAST